MRRNKIISYFFLILTFFSCSSDDNSNSEFAIGEWLVTKRIVSGEEIELNACDPHVVYFFREDFVLESFLINESDIPSQTICGIGGELYRWKIIDENKYGQTHICCPDDIRFVFEKQGSKLVVNSISGNSVEYSRRK